MLPLRMTRKVIVAPSVTEADWNDDSVIVTTGSGVGGIASNVTLAVLLASMSTVQVVPSPLQSPPHESTW